MFDVERINGADGEQVDTAGNIADLEGTCSHADTRLEPPTASACTCAPEKNMPEIYL